MLKATVRKNDDNTKTLVVEIPMLDKAVPSKALLETGKGMMMIANSGGFQLTGLTAGEAQVKVNVMAGYPKVAKSEAI